MDTGHRPMSALSAMPERLHALTIPLAMSVFAIGATATLFRPAFTINAPVVALAPPAKVEKPAAGSQQVAALPQPDGLATGRSADVRLPLPAEEVARMVTRGKALMDAGDFAAARLLLNRAADAGDAGATFALAATYDPNVLAAKGARGLIGDPGQARALYSRALTAGVADARQRIDALGS